MENATCVICEKEIDFEAEDGVHSAHDPDCHAYMKPEVECNLGCDKYYHFECCPVCNNGEGGTDIVIPEIRIGLLPEVRDRARE